MYPFRIINDLVTHERMVDFIKDAPEKERKIASKIYYKYWEHLKLVYNQSLHISFGIVSFLITAIIIIFRSLGAFPGVLESSYLSPISILLSCLVFFLGLFFGVKYRKSCRYIDKIPELKKDFDKLMENPLAQNVLKSMIKIENSD